MRVIPPRIALALVDAMRGQDGFRVGAVVAYRNEILGTGTNKSKTHPLQWLFAKNEYAIYQHAEIAAISDALRRYKQNDLAGAAIYVARKRQDETTGCALPCRGCMSAVRYYNMAEIYWTTDNRWEARDVDSIGFGDSVSGQAV